MRRHAKISLAFTPFARATTATDAAPGFSVSSTIRRRSSLERNNRVRQLFNVTTFSADCAAPIDPPLDIYSSAVKDEGAGPDSLHVTQRTVTPSLAMTALFGMLHLFSAENMKRHGFYGVTEVGNVNLFMRPVTLNLDGESLKPGSIEKLPPDMRELSDLFQTMRNEGVNMGLYSRVDAYLLAHRPDLQENGYAHLDDWGRYMIRTQPTAFVTGNLIEMESITDSYDLSMINIDNLRRKWFTPALQYIQQHLKIFSLHLTWILIVNGLSLIGYFIFALRRKRTIASLKKGILLAYLWLLTVYTIGFLAFGSFSIGSRAKVPVEPLAFLHLVICLFYLGSLGCNFRVGPRQGYPQSQNQCDRREAGSGLPNRASRRSGRFPALPYPPLRSVAF